MKSLLVAVIVAGTLSQVAALQGAQPSGPTYYRSAPQPYYGAYAAPIPYRTYQPVYGPYAHGGRQVGGYVWGFPWRGGY